MIFFLIALATIWNQPFVGAVTGTTAKVQIGLSEEDSAVVEYGLTAGYGTKSDTVKAKYPELTLTNLISDTLYHYKAVVWRGGDSVETADRTFRTQNTTGTYSFAIYGDIHGGNNLAIPAVVDSLLEQIQNENVDFCIGIGDLVDVQACSWAKGDTMWHNWNAHFDSLLDQMSFQYVMGNHETWGLGYTFTQDTLDSSIVRLNNNTAYYNNGSDSGYYWFEWGDCAFVVLYDNWLYGGAAYCGIGETQNAWARTVFYDSLTRAFNWRFEFSHHTFEGLPSVGLFTSEWWRGAYPVTSYDRDSIQAYCDSANMNVNFHGHRHVYCLQGLIDSTTQEIEGGTIKYPSGYSVITGGGGGKLHCTQLPDICACHYLLINIYPESLKMYVKSPSGDTLSIFSIYKHRKRVRSFIGGKIKM